jgi:hypothetical protein
MTERVFGRPEQVLNLPHNTYEQLGIGSVIIRKSSVRSCLANCQCFLLTCQAMPFSSGQMIGSARS